MIHVMDYTRYPTLSRCHATHPNYNKSKARQNKVPHTIMRSRIRRMIMGTKEEEYIKESVEYYENTKVRVILVDLPFHIG